MLVVGGLSPAETAGRNAGALAMVATGQSAGVPRRRTKREVSYMALATHHIRSS